LARTPPGAASTERGSADRTSTVAVTKPGDGTALGEGVRLILEDSVGGRLGNWLRVGACEAVRVPVEERLVLPVGACEGVWVGVAACEGDPDGVPVAVGAWLLLPLDVGVAACEPVADPLPVGVTT
jgi:hypothetical protein